MGMKRVSVALDEDYSTMLKSIQEYLNDSEKKPFGARAPIVHSQSDAIRWAIFHAVSRIEKLKSDRGRAR